MSHDGSGTFPCDFPNWYQPGRAYAIEYVDPNLWEFQELQVTYVDDGECISANLFQVIGYDPASMMLTHLAWVPRGGLVTGYLPRQHRTAALVDNMLDESVVFQLPEPDGLLIAGICFLILLKRKLK